MALEITDKNFNELLNGNKPVVVDFWAEWCGPCRMIGPIIEELSHEYEGKAIIGKVNIDENEELPTEFGIRSIPTVLFFKGGSLVDKLIGATSKNVLEDKLKALL
jgi:thioredoxin 1